MSEITSSELHAAIEDKLCAYFGVTSEVATDDQVFQAVAMVIREIMSRSLAVQEPAPERHRFRRCRGSKLENASDWKLS